MSGYIMNLGTTKEHGAKEKLELYARYGAYGTIINRPRQDRWSHAHEVTLADYLTIRPGALAYFTHFENWIEGLNEFTTAGQSRA